jgi:pre-mRNA-processing factor 6
MQAVQLEREQNNLQEAFKLCEESLKNYPNFPKLWIIAAQLKEQLSQDFEDAAEIYTKGVFLT